MGQVAMPVEGGNRAHGLRSMLESEGSNLIPVGIISRWKCNSEGFSMAPLFPNK